MMFSRLKEGLRELGSSVFALTADERKILYLILSLAVLGLGAKVWHHHRLAETAKNAPEQTEER